MRHAIALFFLLSAFSNAEPVAPRFELEKYFRGRTRSWGVFENGAAKPRKHFRTEGTGIWKKGALSLTQTFTYADGTTQRRVWLIRRLDARRYSATANDVVGTATGEASGNIFRLDYVVALRPDNPLSHVRVRQWMYLQADERTVLVRGVVRKFGLQVAQISEIITRSQPL